MDFYDYLKSGIESKECPILHQKPLVRKVNGKIEMQFCCDEFKKDCQKEMLQMLVKHKKHDGRQMYAARLKADQ